MNNLKTAVIIFAVAFWATNAFAQVKVSGRLVDEKKEPIEFANVVLQSPESFQGDMSKEDGNFEVKAMPGNYTFKISVIGYESYETEITLQSDTDLGEIQLKELASELSEVVVRAERIIRQPDRFIVNLANDPTVFGKTGTDILNLSPGVFVQENDGSITINGKTGTKVYINERPRHESGTDLVRYLQTLKAEDIVRIEVLPMAGAEYDASIAGGVIKIILKRLRDDGLNGNVGVSYNFAPDEEVSSFRPSYNMNYKNNRLSLYTQLNYDANRKMEHVVDETEMWTMDRQVHSVFDFPVSTNTGWARLGAIYDLSERQSIGAEAYYSRDLRKNKSFADLTETTGGNRTDITSVYHGKNTTDSYSASANYLLQLDEEGSVFKILLDYHHNEADDRQNYHSEFRGYMDYDSTYRSYIFTKNDLYAATADLSLKFNDYTTFSTGVKYVRNVMDNEILYEYQQASNWNEIDILSSLNTFSEDIAAVYGKFNSRINRIGYSIGLRGEYTQASPWTNKSDEMEKQRYFKLFPSVNVMLPLSNDGQHSLVLNYNRTITRPTFSSLNPFRMPSTEYLYMSGNPKLQPVLADDGFIALRLFNRFNLTAGITNMKDAIGKVWIMDPDAPGVIIQTVDNIASNTTYYLNVNGSVKPFAWWQMNFNLAGRRNEIEIFGEKRALNSFFGFMNNMFSLPKDFLLDLSGFYQSPSFDGSVKMTLDPQVNVTLRKLFFNNRLSAGLIVNNLLDMGKAKAESTEKDFRKNLNVRYGYRTFGFTLNYSFQAGKSVQVKNVQTGAAEEKARLQ